MALNPADAEQTLSDEAIRQSRRVSSGLNFPGADENDPLMVRRKGKPIDLIVLVGMFRLVDTFSPLFFGYLYYLTYSRSFQVPYWPIYGRFALVGAALSALTAQLSGCYQTQSLSSTVIPLRKLLVSFLWTLALGLTLAFLFKALNELSRVWTLLWLASWFFVATSSRMVSSWVVRARMASGHLTEAIAIIGATAWAHKLCRMFENQTPSPHIVGIFDDRRERVEAPFVDSVRSVNELLSLGKKVHIDRIVVALPLHAETRILDITDRVMALSAEIVSCPDVSQFGLLRRPISSASGVTEIEIAARPMSGADFLIKIAADKAIALILLALLAPLMCLIALGIKWTSPGPVFFKQARLGYNNNEFGVLKFRSMRSDLGDQTGGLQARRKDSRVTPLGAFLRRSSLDELPQLLNVLRGDMSLVGPRPLPIGMRTLDKFNHEIVDRYAHRHRVRPGITGWAQVNGCRGATEHPSELQKRVELDLFYIENWSLRFDVKILFLTGIHLLHADNAF